MGEDRGNTTPSGIGAQPASDAPAAPHDRKLDLVAFGVVALVVILAWLPTLTSGGRINANEDFLLHAARHEAVRKSLLEHGAFPLRSHWFGGGFPTLGEPEDPALNPLVALSLLFGSAMGHKLIAFVAVLAGGLGTYALARCILEYTRWGALFSAILIGTSLYVPAQMEAGNIPEISAAYLPLCMLLIALSCRGQRIALFLLPLVFYTMLCSGKQGAFMALFYLGVLCLLGVVPMLSTLTQRQPQGKVNVRPLVLLAAALAVTFCLGAVRFVPVLEFLGSKGGIMHTDIYAHEGRSADVGPTPAELLQVAGGSRLPPDIVTVGWLPVVLFAVAACCFWKRALPWVIGLLLFTWLALGSRAPLNLFGLVDGLPVFSAILRPYKYFAFQIVLSIAVGSGQFFWLLPRLPYRWLEHVCAIVLIIATVGFLYPRTLQLQRDTYTEDVPSEYAAQQEGFFNVQGLALPRNRSWPPRAVTYLNLLQNVGTIDWHTPMPIAENAVPRYSVDAGNSLLPNWQYHGEVFFAGDSGQPAVPGSLEQAPAGSVTSWSFGPNSIVADVIIDRPSVLVINQNYHPAWRTDQGDLFERDGLLAVRLSDPGPHTIHLRYLPRSFVAGLIITILSLTAWALACWKIGGRLLQ